MAALEALEILRALREAPKTLEDLARELVPTTYRSIEDLRKDLALLHLFGWIMPVPDRPGYYRLSEKALRRLRHGGRGR